jgi:quercetin dioxygenase-like cupin family protein
MDTEQRRPRTRQYEPAPHYPVHGDTVAAGWAAAAATVPATAHVLALDGPAALNWAAVAKELAAALAEAGRTVELADVRTTARPWPEVLERTETAQLQHDPDFARLAGGTLGDLLDPAALARLADSTGDGLTVLYGPGAGLADADVLWWAEIPKRYQEAAVAAGHGRHLAAPAEQPTSTRRLFYIDWPLLDRHRDALAGRIDRWVDVTDTEAVTSVGGAAVRATARKLAGTPFRTRPTFNSTPWGGHWGQRELGHNPDRANTALGYELIAPESGVLLGDDATTCVEIPFQLVVGLAPAEVLGAGVHELFGTSFPIRFDYLDTVGGGNLSVHCHPQPETMRELFGWPYTQHESYYLMVAGEQSKVFLGLRGDADLDRFHHAAHEADAHGVGFDIERYVQTFPARAGQLYLVPAGTPHGSGEGNVVLEVSATPYLYSLRFYDWLRRDAAGKQRAVHVEHAFHNLDPARSGDAVADQLVQQPRTLAAGDDWCEELIGALPEMFFQVRRIVVEPGGTGPQRTDDRFHVLTLVDGDAVLISTAAGDEHRLNYAETLAIPASVGGYQVHNPGTDRVRLVKAMVS